MKHYIILSCCCISLLVSLELLTYQCFLHLSTPHFIKLYCFTEYARCWIQYLLSNSIKGILYYDAKFLFGSVIIPRLLWTVNLVILCTEGQYRTLSYVRRIYSISNLFADPFEYYSPMFDTGYRSWCTLLFYFLRASFTFFIYPLLVLCLGFPLPISYFLL